MSSQRANKAALKNKLIQGGFPFKFRKINDSGELGDSLIFMLNHKGQALDFLKGMTKEGLGTKNIPDSLNWHFARNWGHMYRNHKKYERTFQDEWAKSANLLERSIAVPVMIKMTADRIDEVANKLLKISHQVI